LEQEKQAAMEQRVRAFLDNIMTNHKDTFIGRLEPRFVSCDAEEQTVLISYPAKAWQANPLGVMQGGVVAAMLDFSSAVLAVCFAGDAPMTVSLQVSYLRGTPVEGEVLVRARATKVGRQVVHAFAECWPADEPGKLTATANCVCLKT